MFMYIVIYPRLDLNNLSIKRIFKFSQLLNAQLEEKETLAKQREEDANITEWDNVKAMIDADYELAARLHAQEQEELTVKEKSKLFIKLMDKRKKHFARLKVEEQRRNPPTKDHKRNQMCTYLKNMAGFTHNSEVVKGGKEKDEGSVTRAEESTSKRAGTKPEQERIKKQKIDDDLEEGEMKKHMEIIVDEEEIAVDAIPLATKPLIINSNVSDSDEPVLLNTPLSNKDECFAPEDDIDEIDAFLAMEVSSNFEEGYFDSEGDVTFLDNLLSDDTTNNFAPKVISDHEPEQNESSITFSLRSDPLHHEFAGELLTLPSRNDQSFEDYLNRMTLLCGISTFCEIIQEEIDIFLVPNDLIPPGVENDDSEDEDIELPNIDHQDVPSIPRPPPEPPDIEKYFEPEAEETVIKEWEDRMERAATTASSLEAEQDSGSGPRVNTLGSREDSMELKELMELYTKLSELELVRINIDDGNAFWNEIEDKTGSSKVNTASTARLNLALLDYR
ncbi:hypothetical protein Tco_0311616 [Tanacetum coccineum]